MSILNSFFLNPQLWWTNLSRRLGRKCRGLEYSVTRVFVCGSYHVAEHVYTVLSGCVSMFVAFPVTSPEWFFAGHLGALLARYGVIITNTGRIGAAAVACQRLFDMWCRVSVFIIFRDASALLLMPFSPLPVRRLPGCGSRCSRRCLAPGGQPAGRRKWWTHLPSNRTKVGVP
jgi:hypothetical protein